VDSGTAERTNRVKPTFLQLCNFSKGYHAAVVSLSHPLPGTAQLQTHSKIKHAIDPSSPARTRGGWCFLPPDRTHRHALSSSSFLRSSGPIIGLPVVHLSISCSGFAAVSPPLDAKTEHQVCFRRKSDTL
jgi:hypothetical protein